MCNLYASLWSVVRSKGCGGGICSSVFFVFASASVMLLNWSSSSLLKMSLGCLYLVLFLGVSAWIVQ